MLNKVHAQVQCYGGNKSASEEESSWKEEGCAKEEEAESCWNKVSKDGFCFNKIVNSPSIEEIALGRIENVKKRIVAKP